MAKSKTERPWWQTGKYKNATGAIKIVVFQVDIGNHTDWMEGETEISEENAFKKRIDLAENITQSIKSLGFHRMQWGGDGGAFAAVVSEGKHPQNISAVALLVKTIFDGWRGDASVELRMTATLLDAKIHSYSGYWSSPLLNQFFKYERNIAKPGSFVITSELRSRLMENADIVNFPISSSYQVPLPNGNTIVCYKDTRFAVQKEDSPHNFESWLQEKTETHSLPNSMPLGGGVWQVGDCTILRTPARVSGFNPFIFEPSAVVPTDEFFTNDFHREAWRKELNIQNERNATGMSLQVTHFATELEDDRHPRLTYRTVPYAEASAFHRFQSTADEDTKEYYRKIALQVLGNGTSIPNILSTAIIVLIGTKEEPQLVIANRARRGDQGYQGNRWAVSIGEQFAPILTQRGDRETKADGSLDISVKRGLEEELLGTNFDVNIHTSIQVFGLEDFYNNFVIMAISDLRPLTFSELAKQWTTPAKQGGPVDAAEHTVIAAIPATSEILEQCMNSPRLPENIWQDAIDSNNVCFCGGLPALVESSHIWQATTFARLALARWFIENSKYLGV